MSAKVIRSRIIHGSGVSNPSYLLANTQQAGLSSLNLSQLLDNSFFACPLVTSFRPSMLQLTLMVDYSHSHYTYTFGFKPHYFGGIRIRGTIGLDGVYIIAKRVNLVRLEIECLWGSF
jgi:hypothetical protein